MRTSLFRLAATTVIAVMSLTIGLSLRAQTEGSVALTGYVTSMEEGPMEGVLVSAKRQGSTITTTVVTDQEGRYRFPRERLKAGHYFLDIWATGYELGGDAATEIAAQSTATIDLELQPASNLASQLSNAEWVDSMPGTPEENESLRRTCGGCHALKVPLMTNYDADTWLSVFERMRHYPPLAFPLMPQLRPGDRVGPGPTNLARQAQQDRWRAQFLASVNLSSASEHNYPLKVVPRPTGKATQVIYTTYDLSPSTRQPHDVIVDSDGMAWYASFGEQVLAKLDPDTGELTEYEIPLLKPEAPTGVLSVQFDASENIWLAMQFQGAVAKFDRQTESFQIFILPEELNADHAQITQLSPQASHVDGKVWMIESGTYNVLRLDTVTGDFEEFAPFEIPRPNIYSVLSDSQNNAYFTVWGAEHIGRIDAKTGEITLYQTPTLGSGPRRGFVDPQDRVWFGENFGNKIGMFDPKTSQFREWDLPPYSYPYDVAVDKHGHVWGGGETSDRIVRLVPETGEVTDYRLPGFVNGRRVFVDSRSDPVAFWIGANHEASIIKLEPLDTPPSSQ
ncbi:MAG: carboxypeptidase regulatory-like domain-containing protein [Pseudomonadota bacterium]|nr:carboxypeptidase regulatory-like domain-containing protein [Pseudomonadota bacterium]